MMPNIRILILGATGFIGREVVIRASTIAEISIYASSRRINESDFKNFNTVNVQHADVYDFDSLSMAMADIDVVINCFRESGNETEAAVAIDNVLKACAKNKVRKLIYFSSIAVYGSLSGIVTEDRQAAPSNWYGHAKLDAERACVEAASDTFEVVILRPSLVYGPHGNEWSLDFIHSIQNGHLLDLGKSACGTANLIYVSDLADFALKLAMTKKTPVLILNVNGTEQVSFNTYFSEIAQVLGIVRPRRSPKLAAIGRKLGRGACKVLSKINRHLAQGLEYKLRARPEDNPSNFSGQVYYSPEHAASLGFSPQTSLREGVRRSVEWARTSESI